MQIQNFEKIKTEYYFFIPSIIILFKKIFSPMLSDIKFFLQNIDIEIVLWHLYLDNTYIYSHLAIVP